MPHQRNEAKRNRAVCDSLEQFKNNKQVRTRQYGHKKEDYENKKSILKANATIKNGKLYLEIKKDSVTGLEGKTIVLEQSKE